MLSLRTSNLKKAREFRLIHGLDLGISKQVHVENSGVLRECVDLQTRPVGGSASDVIVLG